MGSADSLRPSSCSLGDAQQQKWERAAELLFRGPFDLFTLKSSAERLINRLRFREGQRPVFRAGQARAQVHAHAAVYRRGDFRRADRAVARLTAVAVGGPNDLAAPDPAA